MPKGQARVAFSSKVAIGSLIVIPLIGRDLDIVFCMVTKLPPRLVPETSVECETRSATIAAWHRQ